MAKKTTMICDLTGEEYEEDEVTSLPVRIPTANSRFESGAASEIDLANHLIPDDFPIKVKSTGQEMVTTKILAEGKSGMGGRTAYARIIGVAFAGEGVNSHETLGRESVIGEYGDEFVEVLEKAIFKRCVVPQYSDEYPEVQSNVE